MHPGKFLPHRFSSRLFLVTFAAGLLPIIIFTVLISIYGERIQKEIATNIEEGYSEDMRYNEGLLREMGESSMRSKVIEIAHQLDLVIQAVPWMTLADFRNDPRFREMAVQKVGHAGHTLLFACDTATAAVHKKRGLEGKDLRKLYGRIPGFQSILKAGMAGHNASGYYDVKDNDGNVRKNFMYLAPLHNRTADGIRLGVAAIIDSDEFFRPARESRIIQNATKNYLIGASNRVVESFMRTGLLFMGVGILIVSLLACVMGTYLSRVITKLREATARINAGNFYTPVGISASGETATLIEDFNKMVDRLASTTVSKHLLEESETRLRNTNSELIREISERERTEKELAAEKERLAVTLRSIGDGVISADSEGRIVLMNSAAERLTGWRQEHALGRELSEVFITMREASYNPLVSSERLHTGEEETENPFNHKILVSKDGTERLIAETSAPVSDAQGVIRGTVVVFRDIAVERQIEEELLKARRLESLGILAGGIAHDFNSLLAVILSNVAFLKMCVEANDGMLPGLIEAEKACMRGKNLTHQLLSFSKRNKANRKILEPRPLIEDSVMASLAGSHVNCLFSFPDKLFSIEVDEVQVGQVLQTIIGNLDEAMGNRGMLLVSAENTMIGRGNPLPLKEGAYVRLSVEDKGTGMTDDDLPGSRDARREAEAPGKRRNTPALGLSICYSVVQDHGGLITLEAQPEGGRLFHIYLPAASGRDHGMR